MTPKTALLLHYKSIFPILGGTLISFFFLWKAIVFVMCSLLVWRNPFPFIWSGLFMVGVTPLLLLQDNIDFVSLTVHLYLLWMCAEISFRYLGLATEHRARGWWLAAVFLLFCL
jgi:hypothetical protein